jgi:hypothetical protein
MSPLVHSDNAALGLREPPSVSGIGQMHCDHSFSAHPVQPILAAIDRMIA